MKAKLFEILNKVPLEDLLNPSGALLKRQISQAKALGFFDQIIESKSPKKQTVEQAMPSRKDEQQGKVLIPHIALVLLFLNNDENRKVFEESGCKDVYIALSANKIPELRMIDLHLGQKHIEIDLGNSENVKLLDDLFNSGLLNLSIG